MREAIKPNLLLLLAAELIELTCGHREQAVTKARGTLHSLPKPLGLKVLVVGTVLLGDPAGQREHVDAAIGAGEVVPAVELHVRFLDDRHPQLRWMGRVRGHELAILGEG